ncbi:MAG: chorismate synthase [FCB group bacterium]|nr:chorismate synthase [FCB group bacterium]
MLTYLTSGESHGSQLTAIIDGFPAGFHVDIDKINYQLARRQKGYGRGGRMKIERDKVEVVSGLRYGYTLGSPITFIIHNKDWKNWTKIMPLVGAMSDDLNLKEKSLAYGKTKPRPGHADLSGAIKYNHQDMRNVLERASARETAAKVAIGALARQLLEHFQIRFASHVIRIGRVALSTKYKIKDFSAFVKKAENSPVRCINKSTEQKMIEAIKTAKKKRDSLGGIAEIIIRGVPVGLGSYAQSFRRLDGLLAGALMSIPSVKGVEIGLGFKSASLMGSQVHDEIYYKKGSDLPAKGFYRTSNNAGGIEGGITNGEDIVLKIAAKPISTLNKPLKTVDIKTKKPAQAIVERADNCVVPALGVIGEAVTALVLADVFLEKFGSDNMAEIESNYKAFLKSPF